MGEDVSVSLVGFICIHFGYYRDHLIFVRYRIFGLSDARYHHLISKTADVRVCVLYMTGAMSAVTLVQIVRVPFSARAHLLSHPTLRKIDENGAIFSLFLPSCNRNNDSKDPTIGE